MRTNGEPMTPLTAVSEQILQTGGALVSVQHRCPGPGQLRQEVPELLRPCRTSGAGSVDTGFFLLRHARDGIFIS